MKQNGLLWKIGYNACLALAFLASYKVWGIYVATAVLMGGVVVELSAIVISGRRPSKFDWIGAALLMLLGTATLLMGDALFIEWRPTGFYWLCALGLVVSRVVIGTNPLRAVLSPVIALPQRVWTQLLWFWTVFLVALGVINLIVAYRFSLDTWVTYRVFGAPLIIGVVCIALGVWRRHDLTNSWRMRQRIRQYGHENSPAASGGTTAREADDALADEP